MSGEKERTGILFAVAAAIGLYVFRELERRQRLQEAREAKREGWVDEQLGLLRDGELGHRERSAAFSRFGRFAVGTVTFLCTLAIALGALLAVHAF